MSYVSNTVVIVEVKLTLFKRDKQGLFRQCTDQLSPTRGLQKLLLPRICVEHAAKLSVEPRLLPYLILGDLPIDWLIKCLVFVLDWTGINRAHCTLIDDAASYT